MKTPILLLVYIKPQTTKKVISVLRRVKAEKIYISINIPKKNEKKNIIRNNDVKKIIKSINWKCNLIKKERKTHLDSYSSYSSAIKWFFAKEKEGIILEDDTLPSLDFFEFCSKLLKKYRNNKKIAQICGSSFLNENFTGPNYKFSNYTFCWGYATWRRSIKDFDGTLKTWKFIKKKNKLKEILNNKSFIIYWTSIFDALSLQKIKAWDYAWMLSNWNKGKISIIPKKNLIQNIGFVRGATHTKVKYKDWYTKIKPQKMTLKDEHPDIIKPDLKYDKWVSNKVFRTNKFYIKSLIKKYLKLKVF